MAFLEKKHAKIVKLSILLWFGLWWLTRTT